VIDPVPAHAPVTIRECKEADIAAIAAIYRHHVLTSLATFEEIPPSAAEMTERWAELRRAGLPYDVATDAQSRVLGFAYASQYRARSAYRFALEDSIYIAAGAARQGVGYALLRRLIEECAAAGFRQMVAVIGDSANAASIGLHQKAGFERTGLLPAVGFKFGRWVDSVIMQRALGSGAATLPG